VGILGGLRDEYAGGKVFARKLDLHVQCDDGIF
jgi:hypothetical protein